MTIESIRRRIGIIKSSPKNSLKIKLLIDFVEENIQRIPNFDLRDSLEEELTKACCCN